VQMDILHNQLIGNCEDARRDSQPERFGGFGIHHQIKLSRSLDGYRHEFAAGKKELRPVQAYRF